jgi:lysozyme family protein
MNFDQAFDRLIGHEGAYSNHAADKGGATMYGITVAVARAQGYQGDMHMLPINFAKGVYRRAYWDVCCCDDLPASVRFDVFDAAVNSGGSQAAKWLQRALGVADDGVIGPKTLAAAHACPAIASKFNGQRLRFMTDLANWPQFGKGWARRIASNLMGA